MNVNNSWLQRETHHIEYMSKQTITKEQVRNLISNVYGFMNGRDESLYYCQDDYVHDQTFELVDIDGNYYEFTYDNAEVCNGSVTFEATNGVYVTFIVLIVPTDGSELMPRLLNAIWN